MPTVVRSREAAIALGASQLGKSWPNPWWPYGNSSYNDCAAFVSWLLFGLNGEGPYEIWVSGIVEQSGLTTLRDPWGIQRGDAVGFLWGGTNNYDHVELALSSPDGNGDFLTLGTNAGPGDDVAVRVRNVRYVAGYGRPAYPGTAGAGTIIEEGEENMLFLGNNTVAWPNGYVNSYRSDVYEAMRLVVEDGNREKSRVDTLVRESWRAVDFIKNATAKAAADLVLKQVKAATSEAAKIVVDELKAAGVIPQ